MSSSGSAILDFGSTPTDAATLAISDANILSSSLVDAWLVAMPTANKLADDHWFDSVKVMAGSIVNAVGFTIYGKCTQGTASGKFTVHWVWY